MPTSAGALRQTRPVYRDLTGYYDALAGDWPARRNKCCVRHGWLLLRATLFAARELKFFR